MACLFWFARTNNDINVLESSHLFSNLASGIALPAHYVIQGKEYDMGYYLADGIYPKWSTIVQTIRDPHSQQKKYFAMKQESCRKDVERAFEFCNHALQLLRDPRFWRKEVLHDIMTTCIILHNMIIEDERDLNAPIQDAVEAPTPTIEMVIDENLRFEQFLARHKKIKDKNVHFELRNALIEHLWEQRKIFEN
ncbi:hypothetical protein R3W88_001737 [Solanum pinnatisectum]|uniref:Uncharacterized protein n=1 Tax=Solanum pinnatisectum TaxID=50273 RepID=A0AAV9MJ17_9SOLN|nr:hypothetical protein R3W88_001737 [Solanum pinnatisectum]